MVKCEFNNLKYHNYIINKKTYFKLIKNNNLEIKYK